MEFQLEVNAFANMTCFLLTSHQEQLRGFVVQLSRTSALNNILEHAVGKTQTISKEMPGLDEAAPAFRNVNFSFAITSSTLRPPTESNLRLGGHPERHHVHNDSASRTLAVGYDRMIASKHHGSNEKALYRRTERDAPSPLSLSETCPIAAAVAVGVSLDGTSLLQTMHELLEARVEMQDSGTGTVEKDHDNERENISGRG
ncbi:hypothetical protein AXG93_4542s1570 [Marchantia polymorpha subsp. ruderalis]|uniref:Uncharacterized protein n=1 Tax=Marchantia polymorpha subsp. ruderalis TaxID=1480154 RepID=A0A176W374_MARPO|nr:hypothetical protein AXG93_4542s1570 [Marchantia polymorpha subsp. ruderalis]